MTAATPGSSAATRSTCPPDNEKPHNATRAGSTSAKVWANAIAARRSARCKRARTI